MILSTEKPQHGRGQKLGVVRAVAKRGDLDLNHVEPVVEIFPEPAVFDGLLQIGVCGRQDADIRLASALVAYPLVFAVLDEAQQLGLDRKRQVADLIQKEGAALAGGDPTGVIPQSPGEGPLHMPE